METLSSAPASSSSLSSTALCSSPSDHSLNDIMASPSPSYLKLEDLQNSPPPPSSSMDDGSEILETPQPVVVVSKQAKKRKSWGQELPEPKTSLPPRKRAKTDDEKEQRRIERIKRNRAAAHNSRERKRQETETLAVALARANAELDAYRKHFGSLPANIVLPEVTVVDGADTPAPSLVDSARGSIDMTASPATPDDDLFDCPIIKEEPTAESTTFPPLFDSTTTADAKPQLLPQLDPTQHSAAMLCDLQCRSTRGRSSTTHRPPTQLPPPSHLSTQAISSWWTTLFLSLLTTNLTATYKTILLALWTLSPQRFTTRAALQARRRTTRTRPSTTSPLTTLSTTTPLSPPWPLARALAQRNAATGPRLTRRRVGGVASRTSRSEGSRAGSVESAVGQSSQRRDVEVVDLGQQDGGDQHRSGVEMEVEEGKKA